MFNIKSTDRNSSEPLVEAEFRMLLLLSFSLTMLLVRLSIHITEVPF